MYLISYKVVNGASRCQPSCMTLCTCVVLAWLLRTNGISHVPPPPRSRLFKIREWELVKTISWISGVHKCNSQQCQRHRSCPHFCSSNNLNRSQINPLLGPLLERGRWGTVRARGWQDAVNRKQYENMTCDQHFIRVIWNPFSPPLFPLNYISKSVPDKLWQVVCLPARPNLSWQRIIMSIHKLYRKNYQKMLQSYTWYGSFIDRVIRSYSRIQSNI